MNIIISSVIWSEQEWKLQNLVFMYHHFYWNDCSPNECIDFYHIQSNETIECDNVSNSESAKWWKKSSQAQKKSKYYQNADWNHCHVSYMSHWKGIITYLFTIHYFGSEFRGGGIFLENFRTVPNFWVLLHFYALISKFFQISVVLRGTRLQQKSSGGSVPPLPLI